MQAHDASDEVADPSGLIQSKLTDFAEGFFYQLPNLIAGITLILVAWGSPG